jgi:hypothetical protein
MRPLAILTLLGGLLISATPASARGAAITYNGHAGLGANHIVTDNKDPDAMVVLAAVSAASSDRPSR